MSDDGGRRRTVGALLQYALAHPPLPEATPRPVVVPAAPKPEDFGNPIGPPDPAPRCTEFLCFVVPPRSAMERFRLGFSSDPEEFPGDEE